MEGGGGGLRDAATAASRHRAMSSRQRRLAERPLSQVELQSPMFQSLAARTRAGRAKHVRSQMRRLHASMLRAVSTGDRRTVMHLVRAGVVLDGSVVDSKGNNALHVAVLYQQRALLRLLLTTRLGMKLDLHMHNERGYTPLDLAVKLGEDEAVKWLQDALQGLGRQLLDAAAAGDKQLILELLRQGADVNYANEDGVTALHQAAFTANQSLAVQLCHLGARLDAKTKDGVTATELALRVGERDVAKAIRVRDH